MGDITGISEDAGDIDGDLMDTFVSFIVFLTVVVHGCVVERLSSVHACSKMCSSHEPGVHYDCKRLKKEH